VSPRGVAIDKGAAEEKSPVDNRSVRGQWSTLAWWVMGSMSDCIKTISASSRSLLGRSSRLNTVVSGPEGEVGRETILSLLVHQTRQTTICDP
jgi:hypothetical protein